MCIRDRSKESKSKKQVEGDTNLSWDHESLEPHPKPDKPKPTRGPKPPRVPRSEAKEEKTPDKTCPKCRGNHNEKDCPEFVFKEEREEEVIPS